jgi:hypothetical protein
MFPSTGNLHRCYSFGYLYIVDIMLRERERGRERERECVYLRLFASQAEKPPDKTNEGSGQKRRKTHPVCVSIDSLYLY